MATHSATRPQRVTDRIEQAVEALIAERGLAIGERLPSERALAEMLGASRNSLREALMRLGERGRITLRKGGNIIAAPPSVRMEGGGGVPSQWAQATIAQPLAPVVAANPGFGHDVMEVRHALEGQAAYYAALRARPEDLDHIRRRFDAMAERHGDGDAAEEARCDAAFHLAIADASHNAVLRSVMSSMFGLMQASISQSLDKLYTVPRTFERLSEQHELLLGAIVAGDADTARRASDDHLAFVAQTVKAIDEDEARRNRASAVHTPSLPAED
ncbi:FCD domain-containing protein [Sphingomonadaceae bacterium jetA1]|jgi:GntR family L-lactate dehydrogenase operon transcriptional regulator|uniref:FCD domain-containing protein n=1 Tax=Facivitalis istanbulensis TaxID=3075838 RepID=UPI003483BBBE